MEKLKSAIRPYLRRHRSLRKLLRTLFRHQLAKVYSWDDVGKLTDEWSMKLPQFDCIIGIPRSGLLVADRIAVNLGLPLSIPELFPHGVIWQSRTKQIPYIRKVLVVEDSVSVGEKLLETTSQLRALCPEIKFYTGALMATGKCKVDYSYSNKWLATPNRMSVLDIP